MLEQVRPGTSPAAGGPCAVTLPFPPPANGKKKRERRLAFRFKPRPTNFFGVLDDSNGCAMPALEINHRDEFFCMKSSQRAREWPAAAQNLRPRKFLDLLSLCSKQ